MVCVVVLGSGGMQFLITFLMISLLEQNVSSNLSFFQLPVIFYSGSCNIDIDSADGTVFMFDAVDRTDTF